MPGPQGNPGADGAHESELKGEVVYRGLRTEDEPFIFSTWLHDLYRGNPLFRECKEYSFYDSYRPAIRAILGKSQAEVRVACLKDEPDAIVGYAVLEHRKGTLVLHWVYTKPHWRRLGIGRGLLQDCLHAIKEVTHLTEMGKQLKPRPWTFNPFLT